MPTVADEAVVRNGGTLNITRGERRRHGGHHSHRRRPANRRSGRSATSHRRPGTLNWTGGNILGDGANGPRLNVGQRDNANNINFTGIVNHSGGKISLNTRIASFLVIGSSGTTPTPTSVYNLMPGGTIG